MYGQVAGVNTSNANNGNSISLKFVEAYGAGTIKCHGRITEIEHHEVFYSKLRKTINSLFRGEPYQFGHQTAEYVVRVEELAGGFTAQTMDFFLFGNYMGRLHPGDEVVIVASFSERNVVKSIYNVVTDSDIKPGLQLSAAFIRFMHICLAFLLIAAVTWGYQLVISGQIYRYVLPVGLIGAGILAFRHLKRKLFRKMH